MPRRFDLIVFDWDGTLMDSTAAIVTAIRAACRDLGVAEPEEARARHVIGLGLSDALAYAAPDLPPAAYAEMAACYRRHYLTRDHELSLFDGIAQLIAELAQTGYLLAVATGKSRAGLERMLDQSGLRRFFDATRTVDECHSKPHPAMLLELMDDLAAAPQRTLMVGDTVHDLQMAANAGTSALAVSYGAHTEMQLQRLKPLAVLGSVEGMRQWLKLNT